MFTVQPFYIAGLDDPDEAKASAFGAMAMFIATFFLSMGGIYYDSIKKANPDDIDTSDTAVAEGYQLNTDYVPGYGT